MTLPPFVRLGPSLVRDVLSIAAPGFLVVCEVLLMLTPKSNLSSLQAFASYSGTLDDASLSVRLTALLAIAVAAYVIGVVIREIVFTVLRRWPHRWKRPTIEMHELRKDLETVFGSEWLNEAVSGTPLAAALGGEVEWKLTEHFADAVGAAARRRRPPSLADDIEGAQPKGVADSYRGHTFAYCKAWLRLNEPRMSVDFLETRIYFFSVLPAPLLLLLGFLPLWWKVDVYPNWLFAIAALALDMAVCFVLFRAVVRMRTAEFPTAVRNYLFVLWWRASEGSRMPTFLESVSAGPVFVTSNDGLL